MTTADGTRVTRGGSFRDALETTGPAARAEQDSSWNERDPQLPKSRWWLSDGPFVGFRLVAGEIVAGGHSVAASGPASFQETSSQETYMSDTAPTGHPATFIETTTAAAAAMMFPSGVHAQGSDVHQAWA